jgi:hypothetical protein
VGRREGDEEQKPIRENEAEREEPSDEHPRGGEENGGRHQIFRAAARWNSPSGRTISTAAMTR